MLRHAESADDVLERAPSVDLPQPKTPSKFYGMVIRPCVILLDLMMPIMDGPTFRAEQLKDPGLSAIPVAIITGAGKGAANELGVQEVLLKPLEIGDVLAVVGRFCTGA